MKYDIKIDDYIGWGNSSADVVVPQIEALEGQPCTVYVSSFGGYTTDGLQIYQAMKEHGNVTVCIFGMSASAATILAMGAKTIKMSKNALMLIHQASLYQDIWGNYNQDQITELLNSLKNDQSTLGKLDEIIAAIYAEHAKGDAKTFAEEMKKEEWLTAEEAKSYGLVDEILEEGETVAMTEDLRHRMVACGYPIPHLQPAAEHQSATFMDRLRSGLSALGLLKTSAEDAQQKEKAATPENNVLSTSTNSTHITMNKTFSAILAVLAVDALAQAEDGSITLSAEQMEAIEKAVGDANQKLTDATNTIAERDQTISDLNQQVENLKKDDGADDDVDGMAPQAEADDMPGALAVQMFNQLKDVD